MGFAAHVIADLTLTNAIYEKAVDLPKKKKIRKSSKSSFRATWKRSLKFQG